MPRLVYNKHHRDAPPGAIYIGRPSKWGNPFSDRADTLAKFVVPPSEVLARFEIYARERFTAADWREIAGKPLVCWCYPKPCHGDVLVRLAAELTPPRKE